MQGEASFDGSRIQRGDHVCFASAGVDEHWDVVTRYLQDGLNRGERCAFVGNAQRRHAAVQHLVARGVPVDRSRGRGALLLIDQDAFYRPEGVFDADRTLAAFRSVLGETSGLGFTGFRGVGGPDFREHEVSEVLRYEAALTDLVTGSGASLICCYDRRGTPAAVVKAGLQTHPSALLAGRLCRNHFFEPMAGRPQRQDERRAVDWMIHQLLRSKDAELQLEETNQALMRQATWRAAAGAIDGRESERVRRAVEMRDTLFSTVAQQLSAPVRAMASALDRRCQQTEHSCVQSIEPLRQGLGRLVRLSDQLSSISGFLRDDVRLEPDHADFMEIATDAVAELRQRSAFPQVELRTGAEGAIPGLWDRDRVRHVLGAMLELAHEHGWGTAITMTVERVVDSVRVAVRYTGLQTEHTGTSAADQACYERLGIELFVARELVRLMDGKLAFATWPDEAVALTVELPRRPEPRSRDELLSLH